MFFGMSAAVSRLGFVLAHAGDPVSTVSSQLSKVDSDRILWESQK